jgi:hypothetical protein
MRARPHLAIGSLAAAVAAVSLATAHVTAQQAARPAAKASALPRLPNGHPDLQGTYDVATITPLERPAEVKGRLVLTDQEAAAMELYEQQRQVKNDAPLDPNRAAPPVGGERTQPKSYLEFLELVGGGVVGGYNNFWLAGGTKVITVNGEKRSSIIVDPPDGKIPAMKAEARQRNARLRAVSVSPDANEGSAAAGPPGEFDDPEVRPLAERCLLGFLSTSGPPTLPNYFYNNMKQIVQTPTQVMILNEMVHDARVIRIGGQHLPAKTQFQGASENLHIVERFTRVDPKTILYRFTVEDPSTWDRPWTGEYPWIATDERVFEYACHEGNYALENMLKGARSREAEDKKK